MDSTEEQLLPSIFKNETSKDTITQPVAVKLTNIEIKEGAGGTKGKTPRDTQAKGNMSPSTMEKMKKGKVVEKSLSTHKLSQVSVNQINLGSMLPQDGPPQNGP